MRAALRPRVVRVEHVGSTAVSGLEAKPILDIVVAVRDLADAASIETRLAPLGYVHEQEHDMPGRLFFVKRTPDYMSTHHVNVTELGTDCWFTHVAFRDYLREHPDAHAEYLDLKRLLARRHAHERSAYTAAKAPFIERILALAAVEREDGAK
jgi:GrpB-like predicted nucleotidyltransferase (UPF0157 family)